MDNTQKEEQMLTTLMTIPNWISMLRIPLALVFLQDNPFYRILAILIAMASDGLDGFLARRTKCCTRVGTTLDPMTDKFFVFFVLGILISEERISLLEAACMLCRDFSVILFGLYLILTRQWDNYRFQAIWCGKITTFLQFIVLIALVCQLSVPNYLFSTFIALGFFALGELYYVAQSKKVALE